MQISKLGNELGSLRHGGHLEFKNSLQEEDKPMQKPELVDATFSSFSKSFRGDPQRSFYVKGNNKKRNTDLLKLEKKHPKQTTDFGSKKSQHFQNLLKTL